MGARRDAPPFEDDVDVVPMREVLGDRVIRWRVGASEVLERLVGKHDAPSKGRVGTVPLQHGDLVPRVSPLDEQRRIQARGSAANDHDSQIRTPGAKKWVPRLPSRLESKNLVWSQSENLERIVSGWAHEWYA